MERKLTKVDYVVAKAEIFGGGKKKEGGVLYGGRRETKWGHIT